MKTCKIDVCDRDVLAKGYCAGHYARLKKGLLLDSKIKFKPSTDIGCKDEKCKGQHYAKGLCQKHYIKKMYLLANPDRARLGEKICEAENCTKSILSTSIFCAKHNERFKAGNTLDLSIKLKKGAPTGKDNHWWKGGVSDYPNHGLLKKQRLKKLESVNYKCEECGKQAVLTHHLDKTKTNHALENLKALCNKCHISIYHKGESGRHSLVDGYTLKELSDKIGCSIGPIQKFLKYNKCSKKFQNKINEVLKEVGYEA